MFVDITPSRFGRFTQTSPREAIFFRMAGSINPINLINSMIPTKPTNLINSITPTKPIHFIMSITPTKPIKLVNSITPAKPITPTKPLNLINSITPTKPMNPTQASHPSQANPPNQLYHPNQASQTNPSQSPQLSQLRWPNTVFVRAFADAIQHVHKAFKKTNMPSIEQSFYLLNARTHCVIFLYNWLQCIDGFSLLLQRYVRKGNDAKNPAIFGFCLLPLLFNATHVQLLEKLRPIALAETCRFLKIQSLEF